MFHKTNKVYSQLVYMYIYRSSVTFLDENVENLYLLIPINLENKIRNQGQISVITFKVW